MLLCHLNVYLPAHLSCMVVLKTNFYFMIKKNKCKIKISENFEMKLHETTEKRNHSGVYFTKQGLFSGGKKHIYEPFRKESYLMPGSILMLVRMTGKLGSICPPSAPPKPRPASSVNQTLVQGLGETEMDRQTEE